MSLGKRRACRLGSQSEGEETKVMDRVEGWAGLWWKMSRLIVFGGSLARTLPQTQTQTQALAQAQTQAQAQAQGPRGTGLRQGIPTSR